MESDDISNNIPFPEAWLYNCDEPANIQSNLDKDVQRIGEILGGKPWKLPKRGVLDVYEIVNAPRAEGGYNPPCILEFEGEKLAIYGAKVTKDQKDEIEKLGYIVEIKNL